MDSSQMEEIYIKKTDGKCKRKDRDWQVFKTD